VLVLEDVVDHTNVGAIFRSGAALGFDAVARWRAWAPDLEHNTVSCGHFMAEEAPAEVIKALRDLLAR